jgi:hypothetical protein
MKKHLERRVHEMWNTLQESELNEQARVGRSIDASVYEEDPMTSSILTSGISSGFNRRCVLKRSVTVISLVP